MLFSSAGGRIIRYEARKMLYLLDANVLIDSQNAHYEFGRVDQFWEWIAFHIEEGRVKMPLEIYQEITAKSDRLAEWANNIKSDLVLNEEVVPELANRVIENGYAPNLTAADMKHIGQDPFLIAYALANIEERIVVTREKRAPKKKGKNRRIPDVCDDFGIKCCDQWEFGRALDFRTDWNFS